MVLRAWRGDQSGYLSLTFSFSALLAVIPWNADERSGVKPGGTNVEDVNNRDMFRMTLSKFGAIKTRIRLVQCFENSCQ